MNNQIKNIFLGLIISVFSCSSLFASESQSGVSFFSDSSVSSDPGGHDSGDDPVDTTPIDSYVMVLLVMGSAVAYYGRNQLKKSIN